MVERPFPSAMDLYTIQFFKNPSLKLAHTLAHSPLTPATYYLQL